MNGEVRIYMPTHPGMILKDELRARGISRKVFAELLGITYMTLSEVINGKRPMSADMALMLEAALGIDAVLWNNTQGKYNLEMARRSARCISRLDAIKRMCQAACF